MSRDTDDTSDSSNSSVKYTKQKTSKKRKHKTEKKHKKHKEKHHKEKKREKVESIKTCTQASETEFIEESFGPALPPHMQESVLPTIGPERASTMIGPIKPAGLDKFESVSQDTKSESDEDAGYGPVPVCNNMNAIQAEREQRALELKIAALEGRGLNENFTDQKTREEWMLELPDVGLRGGLASLSNMKRTFHTGKEKPDFSDRSAWTKTPNSESNQHDSSKSKQNVESLKNKAEDLYERARDAEQERLAKKHKKKHKREESLLELHQKKLRKEQKKKEKELTASGSKPERRPFSRDVDLKLNKIDKHQTKQIVDKAKILNSKFSSGKTKYL